MGKLPLIPQAETIFGSTRGSIQFLTDTRGAVTGLVLVSIESEFFADREK